MKQTSALFHVVILVFSALFFATTTHAQLAGWQYRDAITIQNTGAQKLKYQVLLTINTQSLVQLGRMTAAGDDIRFAKDCNGASLYHYWIESGMNTATTQIWVRIDTLAAGGSRIINMFYGNSAATPGSLFDSTFVNKKIVTAAEAITDTIWNFDWVEIQSGSVALLSQATRPMKLTINARKVKISGKLDGMGMGYAGGITTNGDGPGGGGKAPTTGGGGGGYGNTGGNGSWCCANPSYAGAGGSAYGTNNLSDIQAGSGGGPPGTVGSGNYGANGGGRFLLQADVIDVSGQIIASGDSAIDAAYCGGGGAGGGIMLKGNKVTLTGSLVAEGGDGGNATVWYGGGGGAGGRIKVLYDTAFVNTGTTIVTGGALGVGCCAGTQAQPGGTGTFFSGTYVSDIPSYTIMPHVILSSSNADTICPGTPVTFTASGGFSNYSFYVNTASAQSSASTSFTTSALNDGDVVKVLGAYAGSCMDTSNPITIDVHAFTAPNLGPDTIVCTGANYTLNPGSYTDYMWYDNTTASTYVVDTTNIPAGTYTIYLDVTGTAGCTGSDTAVVILSDCVGKEEIGNGSFQLVPNPGNGLIRIYAGGESKIILLEVTNLQGEIIESRLEIIGSNNPVQLDLTALAKGIYFLRVNDGRFNHVEKIILQ